MLQVKHRQSSMRLVRLAFRDFWNRHRASSWGESLEDIFRSVTVGLSGSMLAVSEASLRFQRHLSIFLAFHDAVQQNQEAQGKVTK